MESIFTPEQIRLLENKLTELFSDCIEITALEATQNNREYVAHIVYDGTNNKANKGMVIFTCRAWPDTIEEFNIVTYYGINFLKRPLLD